MNDIDSVKIAQSSYASRGFEHFVYMSFIEFGLKEVVGERFAHSFDQLSQRLKDSEERKADYYKNTVLFLNEQDISYFEDLAQKNHLEAVVRSNKIAGDRNRQMHRKSLINQIESNNKKINEADMDDELSVIKDYMLKCVESARSHADETYPAPVAELVQEDAHKLKDRMLLQAIERYTHLMNHTNALQAKVDDLLRKKRILDKLQAAFPEVKEIR